MKLVEYQVADFMERLASDAPAPGGGSASALMGAAGASLAAMVAGLTLGKEKYREFAEQTEALQVNGTRLQKRFLELIDLDTEAFNEVSAAYKLPKADDAEKETRRAAIEQSLQIDENPVRDDAGGGRVPGTGGWRGRQDQRIGGQ